MKHNNVWQRVSRRRPCPVCGKPDWCLYAGDDESPDAVICVRIESPKRCGKSGWLHVLRRDGPTWSPRVRRIELSAMRIALTPGPSPASGRGEADGTVLDLEKMAADCVAAAKPEALEKLVVALGLSLESLHRLGVGWSAKHRAWSFPMKDAAGKVLGMRLRLPGGKKLSVKGGHEGLFIPSLSTDHCPPSTLLLIAEGPTDTAALLDFGFAAVGRPSCSGGVQLLIELVGKQKPSGVVIVADGDAPGQRGAETLASVLLAYSQSVRIITPPSGIKDAREWRRSGATMGDVQAVIDAAPVRRLTIATRMRRKAVVND